MVQSYRDSPSVLRRDVDADGRDLTNLNLLETDDGSIAGWPFGRALDQNSFSDRTEHAGNVVSVNADSFHEIFSKANAVFVLGGVIYGNQPSSVRYTWDDGTTDIIYTSPAGGDDSNSDISSPLFVEPAEGVKKLEFKNNAGASRDYGYRVTTL